MNYATGCAFNLKELFENFNIKKLQISNQQCKEINNDGHKKRLAASIFKESLKVILNDCIDNNITFKLPVGKNKAFIYLKRTSGEDFKKARRNGKWKDIDYLVSMFSGSELTLEMYNKGKERSKPIYINKELKDKITKNINSGMQYC